MSAPVEKPSVLSTRRLAAKIGVHPRTVTRWSEDKALDFPKPLEINGRHYWADEGEIDRWLRSRASKTTVA